MQLIIYIVYEILIEKRTLPIPAPYTLVPPMYWKDWPLCLSQVQLVHPTRR